MKNLSKIFRTSEAGPDIEGLISHLRKTNPGGMEALAQRGGRLGGVAMANDSEGGTIHDEQQEVEKL